MNVSPLFIMISEFTSGPGPLVGPEVRIKKRRNLHNERKCRFVDVPTKTEPPVISTVYFGVAAKIEETIPICDSQRGPRIDRPIGPWLLYNRL